MFVCYEKYCYFCISLTNIIYYEKNQVYVCAVVDSILFSACDKPYDDSEEGIDDGTEIIGGTDKDTGSDDEDEGDGEYDDDTGISFGDVVDVETFISKPIVDQVWVKGYIVGSATGANGKKRYDFEPPFDHDTALLLADDPATADLSHVVSVCLTSCSKKIREELNLKEHPENRGKVLSVFGFRETYLAIPGIKKIDAYEFSN